MSRPQTDGAEPKPKPDARKGAGGRKLKPLPITQPDFPEGRFTRALYRVFPPRAPTRQNPNTYPTFLSLVERATRMADVASGTELAYMCLAPFLIVASYFWRLWLPLWLGGAFEISLAIYFGLWFVIAVFLDRRLDADRGQRKRHSNWTQLSERESWLVFRQEMTRTRDEVREQAREAKARGQEKAAPAGLPTGSGAGGGANPATPSIDDLLQ